MDQSASAVSKLKYVNLSASTVVIGGVSVSANNVKSIRTVGGYGRAVTAMDDQVCYASGLADNGNAGSHNVTCFDRSSALGITTLRVGPNDNDSRGGGQLGTEQEGIPASSASLYSPYGLTFDAEGNLYITEYSSHVIRKVARWW